MLLPKLTIPTSIEMFEANFGNFFHEYKSNESNINLEISKSIYSTFAHRFSINYEEEKSETSHQTLIGEIDVVGVNDNKTDIRAAVYHVQDFADGLKFFDNFYFMVFKKWDIEFDVDLLNCKRGEGATMAWVKIGWGTGYFCLPEIYDETFHENDCYDYFLKFEHPYSDLYDHYPDSYKKEIKQEYELKYNEGLPDYSDEDVFYENKRLIEQEEAFVKPEQNLDPVFKPWEHIPDKGYDRLMVKLWCEDQTAKEIGDHKDIKRAERTILDRICKLRKKYPEAKIPYHLER